MDGLMSGRTVFVIAHRLSTVRNAKAIMVLEQGEISAGGNAVLRITGGLIVDVAANIANIFHGLISPFQLMVSLVYPIFMQFVCCKYNDAN